MNAFAALLETLDTLRSAAAAGDPAAQAEQGVELQRHFTRVTPADAAWAVALLAGRAPKPPLSQARLRQLGPTLSGLDGWLFDACCQATGDAAEAIAKALPAAGSGSSPSLAEVMAEGLAPLRGLEPDEQVARLRSHLARLDPAGRFVLLKLVAGGLRVPIRPQQLHPVLADMAGVPVARVVLRLDDWNTGALVDPAHWHRLVAPAAVDDDRHAPAQPLPFTPTRRLAGAPPSGVDLEGLGACGDWLVGARHGGVRAQLVRRAGACWIWSADVQALSSRLPEVTVAAATLPDGCVLEGELLLWPEGCDRPGPVDPLLQRFDSNSNARRAAAAAPVVFMADDLLESDGQDRRDEPLRRRRERLAQVLAAAPRLRCSALQAVPDWPAVVEWHRQLRDRGQAALVLKPQQGRASAGAGAELVWTADALTVDAVLLYVQPGAGGLPGSALDCTLALWNRPPRDAAQAQSVVDAIVAGVLPQPDGLQLVPVARAAATLQGEQLALLEREVRAHTLQSFGPVRSLRPRLVLSLAFDGLSRSARRKSGVQLRGARLLGLRDMPLHAAGDLPALLLRAGEASGQAPGSPDTVGSLRTS